MQSKSNDMLPVCTETQPCGSGCGALIKIVVVLEIILVVIGIVCRNDIIGQLYKLMFCTVFSCKLKSSFCLAFYGIMNVKVTFILKLTSCVFAFALFYAKVHQL